MQYNDFIYRLISYLDEHNYSQSYLAKQIDYSKAHISNMLSGNRKPTPKFLKALEEFTGLNTEYWLTGESKKPLYLLNSLIDSLIETGLIDSNGNFDKDTEEIIMMTLKKEIKNKLLEKQQK